MTMTSDRWPVLLRCCDRSIRKAKKDDAPGPEPAAAMHADASSRRWTVAMPDGTLLSEDRRGRRFASHLSVQRPAVLMSKNQRDNCSVLARS